MQGRLYIIKVLAVWAVMFGLILTIGALRATDQREQNPVSAVLTHKERSDTTNPAAKKRDYLKQSEWPEGVRVYRDWWKERQAAICVVEMDRRAKHVAFDVALANEQIVGRERITSIERRLAQQGMLVFGGVNGSFGIREDNLGRGGAIFNLHIQDKELVSFAPRRDRWGYSPPTPWGETSFGVTAKGEFLLDGVELNGKVRIDDQALDVVGVNQLVDSGCSAVIYTPRFGDTTLTRYGYEVILKQIELPLSAKYHSRFVVSAVNEEGNTSIPQDGVVLALDRRTAREWRTVLVEGAVGTLDIALSPEKWQQVPDGIGGNIRLLRNREIEPEVVNFHETRGGSAPHQANGAHHHPRSALGFNAEKLFLVVVDGRQHGYSLGMTFYELAGFMRDLGATDAINFDGGSSSTLWALGDIVNRPSHGYERRVFNVAMVVAKPERVKQQTNVKTQTGE